MVKGAVDNKFEKFEGDSLGAKVSWAADATAADGNVGAVGVCLFGTEFANNLGVGDFFAVVGRDVILMDNKEGVSDFDPFSSASGVRDNKLVEAAKLFGVGIIRNVLVFGMFA